MQTPALLVVPNHPQPLSITLQPVSPHSEGAEGYVRDVAGMAEMVVKQFKAPTPSLEKKLELMMARPPSMRDGAGNVFLTWPVAKVIDTKQHFMGYAMPKISHAYKLAVLMSRFQREQEKLELVHVSHLVGIARNLAVVVQRIHEAGYVIGDFNDENVLVRTGSVVSVIDTDSFQVSDSNSRTVFRCTKDRDGYRAPERVGKDAKSHLRTMEEDLFVLGVLIYRLMMDGIHPYDGIYSGKGDPPRLDERIAQGWYPHLGASKFRPRTNTPFRHEHLPSELRMLFDRCFHNGGRSPNQRPKTSDWVEVLDRVSR